MPHLRWFFATLLFAIAPSVWGADEGWRLEKDDDGIQICTRAVDGWSIREIRGVTRFQGHLSSLVAVIGDISASPELNEFVVKSSVEKRDSDTRYQVYSLTDMPWPLTDRDILIQRQIAQDPTTLAVAIADVATQDIMPVKEGLVRIVRSRTQWTLTPAADGSVLVELRMLSDPAGPIPPSLLNALSISTPFKTLAKLKELAQRPKYAQARLAFIREATGGM
ncbi:MAG: hypothetical protein WC809_17275 [Sinimarinibacterium sp.]|jgi:hypothetical protein